MPLPAWQISWCVVVAGGQQSWWIAPTTTTRKQPWKCHVAFEKCALMRERHIKASSCLGCQANKAGRQHTKMSRSEDQIRICRCSMENILQGEPAKLNKQTFIEYKQSLAVSRISCLFVASKHRLILESLWTPSSKINGKHVSHLQLEFHFQMHRSIISAISWTGLWLGPKCVSHVRASVSLCVWVMKVKRAFGNASSALDASFKLRTCCEYLPKQIIIVL